MTKIFYESDANLDILNDKTVGVLGYGSQGHAHALNLKDSGINVMVGLYEGSKSWAAAEAEGLSVGSALETARKSDIIMMLVPDHSMSTVYKESVQPELTSGKTLMFAHGFNIHYQTIVPPKTVDVSMVAPKAPGHRVREVFQKKSRRSGPSSYTSRCEWNGS